MTSAVTTFARLAQSEDTFLKQNGTMVLGVELSKNRADPPGSGTTAHSSVQGGMYQKEARAINR